MEHPEVFIVCIISLLFSIFCIVEQFYNVFYSVRLSIMGLMIPFKCGLHMQRLWPGGRGVLVRCWFSVDPASIRWVGIETTVGRRPVFTVCFVCPLSTRRWPFVCGDTLLDDGGVDPTFGQSFVFSVYPFAIRQWYSGRRGICLATARCRANVSDIGPALARAGRMPSLTN